MTYITLAESSSASSNLLDNGGFEIWQRGTSFSNVSGPGQLVYTADRWGVVTDQASTVTVSKETSTIDTGLASMKVVISGTSGGHVWYIRQNIENIADYRGKQISFSIRVNASTANAIKATIQDNISGAATSSFATTGGWVTLTGTMKVDPAATILIFQVGMLNVPDKQDGTYYFDSAVVSVGSTPVSFIPTNPQVDLARCMRYFQVIGGTTDTYLFAGMCYASNNAEFGYSFPVPMRIAPTVTVNNTANWGVTGSNGATISLTGFTVSKISTNVAFFNLSVTTGLAQGNSTILYCSNANATTYFSADF